MVRKDKLIEFVNLQATEEASRRGLDKFDTETLVEEAEGIIEDIFLYLRWSNVEGDTVKSVEPLTSWRHRELRDLEEDWKFLEIGRRRIQEAAERYLDRPWMHCRDIDWLVVNLLTYAEYQAFLDHLRTLLVPWSVYLARQVGGFKLASWAVIWQSFVFSAKWLVWLSVMFAAYILISGYLTSALAIVTLWWVWRKRAARKKLQAVLDEMLSTYAGLQARSLSWPIVWESLGKSRDVGAVWDGIVYRLVEERLNAQRDARHGLPASQPST